MKLSSLRPEHLECRSMGHAWTHVDDRDHMVSASDRKQIIRFWREERCLRCGAEREREVDLSRNDVRVTRARIRYPEGYVLRSPRVRVTRAAALGAQYGREVIL